MISQRRNDPGQLSEDAMLAIINGWAGAGLAVAIHLTARPRVMRISGWIQLIMFTLHTGEAVTAASHNVRQPQQFSGGWLHPPTTLSHLWQAQTQTRWRNIRSVLTDFLSRISVSNWPLTDLAEFYNELLVKWGNDYCPSYTRECVCIVPGVFPVCLVDNFVVNLMTDEKLTAHNLHYWQVPNKSPK